MTASEIAKLSDEALVNHIRTSSSEDFRFLVDRYQNKLFYYTLKFVHDEEKAKDVLQEAFVKMFINLNSFDVDKNFSAWSYRIVHNEALNYIKKHGREIQIDDENWLMNIPDEAVDLTVEIDKKTESEKIRKAVFQLPMKYKDVLILYYFEGQSYDQISKALQIPTSSVGTRVRRGKNKLKKILSNMELLP